MPTFISPSLCEVVPNIVAGFSTRQGGVSTAPYASLNLSLSTDDDDAHVQVNRRRLFEAAGVSVEQLAIAGQVHGARVLHVTEPGLYPGYDALVTDTPGLVLCITAADCAVILLVDPIAGVMGAVHSGWRGTVAGISRNALALMEERGACPERLLAYISPCISMENFEVGPEVAAQFDEAFVHYLPGEPRPRIDLKAVLAAQLTAAGVPPETIEVSQHCTFAETDMFFSHRAEQGTTGRMMGFIGKVEYVKGKEDGHAR